MWAVANCIRIANYVMNKVALANFTKPSQEDWQRANFATTLRASLFNDELTIETILGQIHLLYMDTGQYTVLLTEYVKNSKILTLKMVLDQVL
jgi:hypothetical protein